MKIQFHRIDTNVVVGLLVREFCCSGTDVSAKVLAMYADTRTPSMEPQWLAAGLSQCLGISDDTRRNINRIYDFKTGCVKPECLHDGWQTSGSEKVVRMAFNLYCNGTPSVDDEQDTEEQIDECRRYSVEDLFCCCYAPFFWQAIQIRYPEYANYNHALYAMFGGND